MTESFEYVKQLVIADRYKNYNIDEWGGCDVIIISNKKYKQKKDIIDNWISSSDYRILVKTDFASTVIWLIETLKPYINCDYLNKYTYYAEIATFINFKLKESVCEEKQLLLNILEFLGQHKWEKELSRTDLEKYSFTDWYNFGIEHNDPFFVKFVALWMAFNERFSLIKRPKSSKEENYHDYSERTKINIYCENNEKIIESVHQLVWTSPFIKIFLESGVKDMRAGYLTKDNENDFKKLTREEGIEQSKALFQTIYQVRCNLFHGSKSPDDKRDINLVRCAGEIMEIYMKTIMER